MEEHLVGQLIILKKENMDIKELRIVYSKIQNYSASLEEKKKFLDSVLNIGGMSIEWFYSNLIGIKDEPSDEEIERFKELIQTLFKEQ